MAIETFLTYLLFGGGAVYVCVCAAAILGQFRARPRHDGDIPSVSVIVPARNEAARIGALLDDLMAQDYPAELLEIVVVDDQSEDGTADVVRGAMTRDSRIRLETTADADLPFTHKKGAVYRGIEATTGEIIMTVDADARVRQGWVRGKAQCFADGIDLVAGDVTIEGGGLMGWIEALEMVALQTVSSGLMNLRLPVTCNGANLAYRRAAYERVGGFGESGRFVSGDDDMLMQRIAMGDPRRVVYIPGPDDAVITDAVGSFGEFIARRTRWTSKISGYPSKSALGMLTLIALFLAAIPAWVVLMLTGNAGPLPLLSVLAVKVLTDLGVSVFAAIRFRRPGLLAVFPLAEIAHIPYIILVTLSGTFGSFEWRGRRVHATGAAVDSEDQAYV